MKNKKSQFILLVVVAVLLVAGLVFIGSINQNKANKTIVNLDSFAQCIKDSGAKFYGAFWCSHCQAEKKLFGSSEKYLPYVECATSNPRVQTQICKDEKIEAYPTWVFSDGTKTTGEMSLTDLAAKTQCKLP